MTNQEMERAIAFLVENAAKHDAQLAALIQATDQNAVNIRALAEAQRALAEAQRALVDAQRGNVEAQRANESRFSEIARIFTVERDAIESLRRIAEAHGERLDDIEAE